MLVGSFASSAHGAPRSTYDIDLVIDPTHEALDRFAEAFDSETVYIGPSVHDALDQRDQFNLIDTSSGWKVDLMILKDRPFDHTQFERRRMTTIGDVQVWIAAPEDTVLAKLEWAKLGGSERQIADAGGVLAAGGDALDHDYIDRWAEELGIRDLLERARQID